MVTDVEFRVIDLETGKARAKGTEAWTDAEYREWMTWPLWRRYTIVFPRIGLFTILATAVAVVFAALRS